MAIWAAAFDSGNHGSLSSFARAIASMVFGWDKTETGDFPLDVSYLLPRNHWYRSKDPADCQETQVDPFCELAELSPDDDAEPLRIEPDPSRVEECSDQGEDTLEYSKLTRNGDDPEKLENTPAFQQMPPVFKRSKREDDKDKEERYAEENCHSQALDAPTPPSQGSKPEQASSIIKARSEEHTSELQSHS